MQRQVFLPVEGARRSRACLSERTFFLLNAHARGKAWIAQAANVPIADTFDPSHVIRQHNQWVRRRRECQGNVHHSFLSA